MCGIDKSIHLLASNKVDEDNLFNDQSLSHELSDFYDILYVAALWILGPNIVKIHFRRPNTRWWTTQIFNI